MTLPDYFFADLPAEASLTGSMIRDACVTLKKNRATYLRPRSTSSLIKTIASLAENWLDPDYPLRQLALEQGPTRTGFTRTTLAKGLNAFFEQLTQDNLCALIAQDLGHIQRLDDMVSGPEEVRLGQSALARGPELLGHVTAGNLPCPALMSIILGLLVRSAQFVKAASGTSWLLRLFGHSLHEIEPKLAACLEIAEWPGGTTTLESTLFEHADCVTATGSDETLQTIQRHLPPATRFLGYGHKVSFGYISQEVLSRFQARKLATAAAEDVAAWNQLGCLSPHLLYVEVGGSLAPEEFAELLANALVHQESIDPRGSLPLETSARIAHLRSVFEIRALNSSHTRVWSSPDSTAWTVVYETDPLFHVSCLNRFIFVKAVRDVTEALHHAESVRGKVSTVGLAAIGEDAQTLARQLADWGVTRICPIGQMQKPPLTWRHDGRPALGDLVTWTQWER